MGKAKKAGIIVSLLFTIAMLSSTIYAIDDESLVLYCPFDEGKGDTTEDRASGLVGKLDGAGWTGKGKIGNAVEFDTINDFVEFPPDPVLHITDAVTMEAWIRPNTVQEAVFESAVVSLLTPANLGGYCMLWTEDKVETWIHVGDWKGTRPGWGAEQTIVPEPEKWHHIAGIYTGTEVIQYVDGKLDCRFDLEGKMTENSEGFRVGKGKPGIQESMLGIIDEVAVYNRALTEDEVNADMKLGVIAVASPDGSLATTWADIKNQ